VKARRPTAATAAEQLTAAQRIACEAYCREEAAKQMRLTQGEILRRWVFATALALNDIREADQKEIDVLFHGIQEIINMYSETYSNQENRQGYDAELIKRMGDEMQKELESRGIFIEI
jgi:hypothetical protein